jgi:hypothetical protein
MLAVQGPSKLGYRRRSLGLVMVASAVTMVLSADPGWGGDGAAGSCVKLSDVQIVQLLNRWRAEFMRGSPARLSELYADEATLIATSDGKPYKGKKEIRAYYKDFLAKHPGLSMKPSSLRADCGRVTVSGPVIYRVTGERKGTRTLLGGRYTTEFELEGGKWLIVRHSLAADPRKVGDPIDTGAGKRTPRL